MVQERMAQWQVVQYTHDPSQASLAIRSSQCRLNTKKRQYLAAWLGQGETEGNRVCMAHRPNGQEVPAVPLSPGHPMLEKLARQHS
jgi:hypothetical protein